MKLEEQANSGDSGEALVKGIIGSGDRRPGRLKGPHLMEMSLLELVLGLFALAERALKRRGQT